MFMFLATSALGFLTVEEPAKPTDELVLNIIPGFSVDSADPTQDCHYADPFKQSCKPDELTATIKAKPTSLKICVSKCDTDSDCPQDVCPGVTASPKCFLQDATGQKYCGLPCAKTKPKCSTDEHMVCEPQGFSGICAYAS